MSTLCRTMPTYVPSGVPAEPIASAKRLPPIATSKPRARTASCTASIVRGETDDSTKIAGIRRVGDQVGEPLHVLRACLRGSRDPLQADDLVAVRPPEVPERVVRGDDHACSFGNARALGARLVVEGVELPEVRVGTRPVALGVRGIGGHERVADLAHRSLPELRVEPDVRVVLATAGRDQLGAVDPVGHGPRQPPLADPLEDVGHLRLEVEAAVEDHVRPLEPADVALARLVEVRIDPRAHQPLDLHPRPTDVLDRVGDHPDRRHDANLVLAREVRQRRVGNRPAAHCEQTNEHGEEERTHCGWF